LSLLVRRAAICAAQALERLDRASSKLHPLGATRGQIRPCVPAELELAARITIEFVPPSPQAVGEFVQIYRRCVLLASIELPGLQRARLASGIRRDVEHQDMSMELRCGVIVLRRSRAVVLEERRNPATGGLRRVVATDSCLREAFELIKTGSNAGAMRVVNSQVASDKGCHRHAYRRRDRCIPARAVSYRSGNLTAVVDVGVRPSIIYEHCTAPRVATRSNCSEDVLRNGLIQPP